MDILVENVSIVHGSMVEIQVVAVTCVFRYPGGCGHILQNVDNIVIM